MPWRSASRSPTRPSTSSDNVVSSETSPAFTDSSMARAAASSRRAIDQAELVLRFGNRLVHALGRAELRLERLDRLLDRTALDRRFRRRARDLREVTRGLVGIEALAGLGQRVALAGDAPAVVEPVVDARRDLARGDRASAPRSSRAPRRRTAAARRALPARIGATDPRSPSGRCGAGFDHEGRPRPPGPRTPPPRRRARPRGGDRRGCRRTPSHRRAGCRTAR